MLYISSLISHLQQIRVDGGKEFLTNNIKDLCCEYEIELKRTENNIKDLCTSWSSGKQHGVIDSMVRAWLKEASLPKTLCCKASVAAVFVRNRSTNSFLKLKTTPYE